MTDQATRDQLSRNLAFLIVGRISNDQFEDSIPGTNEDAAIIAFADMAWLLYGDMKEHRLVGRHSIGPSERREVLRWILFLDSRHGAIMNPRPPNRSRTCVRPGRG